ncbi:hypothetical protein [Actinomyces succiniciruminis]|uniref:Prokaryotic membrane lipoprotein lipid attachment site profile n=1 Tax=Actinomyces succiniciruminis TaxID=1522002 RepID=A0A1L7RNU5_9ACTO|nr:hypothetical protein [Actinomyces succiniciruminis]CED91322.1 Hypothetical protein AAM4_1490 [Actinomyces succiniciruminis]
MTASEDLRAAHLATVAATISRLAAAQQQAVTWALTISAAMTTASVAMGSPLPAVAGAVACTALWMTHAVHLTAERAWRALYAALLDGGPVTATPRELLGPSWSHAGTWQAARSWSVAPLHGAITASLLVIAALVFLI